MELESYLKAVYQEKCDIVSNFLYERRIYHQSINLTFKDTSLTLKIRILSRKSNLFQARDKIIQSFYSKNSTELNIFTSFVLYWAQKRKILSSQVMDKNAWTILIIYFFQINGRLPPSENFDILSKKAQKIEDQCYQEARDQLQRNYMAQNASNQSGGSSKTKVMTIDQVFDFSLFEQEKKRKNIDLTIQYEPKNLSKTREKTLDNYKVFKVLPIIRPSRSSIYNVQEYPNFNYGFFFFKFLYFLNFQLVIDPICVSVSGQIKKKQVNKHQENIEPIAIQDLIWQDINLVQHLSYIEDAFNHLIDQIKLAYKTIHECKSEKQFLSDIPTPVFNLKKGRPKS